MTEPIEKKAPELEASTRLAFERTRVAYDRTLLAWIRTAISLITFGFSIYKFAQIMKDDGILKHHLLGTGEFGLVMVIIGLVSLFLASLEYRHNIRSLGTECLIRPRSLSYVMAMLISLLGIIALVGMLFPHEL